MPTTSSVHCVRRSQCFDTVHILLDIYIIKGLLLLSSYICLWKLTKVHVICDNTPNLLSYHINIIAVWSCSLCFHIWLISLINSFVLFCFVSPPPRSKLNDMIDGIPKSKKNKRCQLHSLDTHKPKPLGWAVRPFLSLSHWRDRRDFLLIPVTGSGRLVNSTVDRFCLLMLTRSSRPS